MQQIEDNKSELLALQKAQMQKGHFLIAPKGKILVAIDQKTLRTSPNSGRTYAEMDLDYRRLMTELETRLLAAVERLEKESKEREKLSSEREKKLIGNRSQGINVP